MFNQKIFIVSIVTIITVGIILLKNENESHNMKLRVAFPYNKPVSAYEPTRIHLAPEYIFLENIYSPLVELSRDNGTPIAGIAESFKWKGDELHLRIRKNLMTIDNTPITVNDVFFSLKRLLVLSGNTHGNFKDLICPTQKIININFECSGMYIENDTLVLKSVGTKAFLITMLAAIDFAIIPEASVDPVTLKIKDYRNTSGPYYVEKDNGGGNIVLNVNKRHYNYSEKMPQIVVLIPSGVGNSKDSITLFKENKVDYITTVDKLNPEKIIKLAEKTGHPLHSTMNIRTFLLTFTPKGLKKYSFEERLAIGKKIRIAFQKYYENFSGYENTNQFFPALGDGSLNEEEGIIVDKLYETAKNITIDNLKLSIVRLGKISQYSEMLKSLFPNIELVDGKNAPAFLSYDSEQDMPDCFIGGPDTGFMEDIGLISYSIHAGFFGLNRDEGSKWLAEYMAIPEKSDRVKMLKKIHLKVLKEAIITPMVSAPYVALVRSPWTIELSQLYANNPLWPIVKK